MKIAICVQNASIYQQLYTALHSPENFRFHDFKGFDISPLLTDFQNLAPYVAHQQVDLVIVDEQLSFFQNACAMCEHHQVDWIGFRGKVDAVIREVDMHASFFTEVAPKPGQLPDSPQNRGRSPDQKEVIVKIGEKIIEKEVEKLRYANIPSKIIVIGSFWPGAGSTLYSMNLARAIADRNVDVSYVEYPTIKPYLFDYLNIKQLESDLGSPYTDYAKMIVQEGGPPRAKGFRYQGVQWVVNDSRLLPVHQWSEKEMSRLLYSLRDTPILLVDISDQWAAPGVQQFLKSVDQIYVCVEPDPVKIDWATRVEATVEEAPRQSSEYQTLAILRELETTQKIHYQYIEMKMNPSVKINTWHECLEKPPVSSLPLIPYEDVMACTWESKFLYNQPQYRKSFEKSFRPLMETFLPNSYLHKDKKSKRIKKWIKRGHA